MVGAPRAGDMRRAGSTAWPPSGSAEMAAGGVIIESGPAHVGPFVVGRAIPLTAAESALLSAGPRLSGGTGEGVWGPPGFPRAGPGDRRRFGRRGRALVVGPQRHRAPAGARRRCDRTADPDPASLLHHGERAGTPRSGPAASY